MVYYKKVKTQPANCQPKSLVILSVRNQMQHRAGTRVSNSAPNFLDVLIISIDISGSFWHHTGTSVDKTVMSVLDDGRMALKYFLQSH
jgi:hypothetical protein